MLNNLPPLFSDQIKSLDQIPHITFQLVFAGGLSLFEYFKVYTSEISEKQLPLILLLRFFNILLFTFFILFLIYPCVNSKLSYAVLQSYTWCGFYNWISLHGSIKVYLILFDLIDTRFFSTNIKPTNLAWMSLDCSTVNILDSKRNFWKNC